MPASRRRPISRASASACRNISRPRRCGRAARCSTSSASQPTEMEFWMERVPSHSHGGATGFKPPPGVTIHQIPAEKSIGSMMLSGELEARHPLPAPRQSGRPQHASISTSSRHQDAVSRSDRRRRALLPQDRHLSDQSRHGGQARDRREASVGGAQPVQGVREGQRAWPTRSAWSRSTITSRPARSRRRRRRRCASRCCATASRPTARCWRRRRNIRYEQGLTPRLMKLEEVFAPSAMDQ